MDKQEYDRTLKRMQYFLDAANAQGDRKSVEFLSRMIKTFRQVFAEEFEYTLTPAAQKYYEERRDGQI